MTRTLSSADAKTGQEISFEVESKGAKIIETIGRTKGATLREIVKAVQWQAHSVRGFISTATKKHGIKIDSTKNEAGDRFYKIAK